MSGLDWWHSLRALLPGPRARHPDELHGAWLGYAMGVGEQLLRRLHDEDEAARGLHQYLHGRLEQRQFTYDSCYAGAPVRLNSAVIATSHDASVSIRRADNGAPSAGAVLLSVTLKVWVNADGYAYRIAFEPLGSRRIDSLLRRIVMGVPLAEPPHGMPLPIHLRLDLSLRG